MATERQPNKNSIAETAKLLLAADLEHIAPSEAEQLAVQLDDAISEADRAYHTFDDPAISDRQFDALKDLRKQLGEKFSHLKQAEETPGSDISSSLEPVRHAVPMLSLDKSQTLEGITEWTAKLHKNLGDRWMQLCEGIICEPKVDGLAVSVRYENGKMVRASTRGDGTVGEDVTKNVAAMDSVPKTLKTANKHPLEIRGEIYMATSAFESLVAEQTEETLKSPRNTAAGAVRQKNPEITRKRNLSWFAFSVGEGAKHLNFERHSDILGWLKEQGLPVCEYIREADSLEEMHLYLTESEETQHERDFQADGSVLKINNLAIQKQLGVTSHHPRWAIAHKFADQTKETILEDIRIQIGPSGKATPVAHLKPVYISESVVSRCTLSNADQVAAKDVRPGDTVVIRKSGDVIPEILGSVADKRPAGSKAWQFPSVCPCPRKAALVRKSGEAGHYCSDSECPEKKWREILRFCSRRGTNIEGLGEKWISEFYRQGVITCIADLYEIPGSKKAEISALRTTSETSRRFGERQQEILAEQLKASLQTPMPKLLYAINTPNVGRTAGPALAEKFGSMDALMAASAAQIAETDSIGNVAAEAIQKFFADPKTKTMIEALKKHGMNMTHTAQRKEGLAMSGETICVTGSKTLKPYSRAEIHEIIESLGGKTSSSVTKSTTLVVNGNPGESSSKLKKAEQLGIEITDGEKFLQIVAEAQLSK